MPRTKEFDRDEAVNTAIDVFRRNGYDATTTDDLRFAIGIGRQSLYDTFGGKKALYLEALRRYNTNRTDMFARLVKTAPTALDGIVEILVATAREDAQERSLRCLGVDAACTFSSDDPEVTAITEESTAALDRVLTRTLARAMDEGVLRTSLGIGDAALLLRCVLSGLRVAARARARPAELRRIALTLVDGLRK